jgi:clostripain
MPVKHLLGRVAAAVGALGVCMALLSGCGGGGGTSGGGSTTVGTPSSTPGSYTSRSACAANPAHNDGRARWTVLVYMNAANNLQPFSVGNIAQMASVGSDSNVNIVVQWKQSDSCGSVDCGTPTFVGTRRYLIHQHSAADISQITTNNNTTVLDSDRLPDPTINGGNVDMGSYLSLQDFVQWGSKNFPADNLALVIWDHGSGWQNVLRSAHGRSTAPARWRALSQDNNSNDEIETWELPRALANPAQPLDMLILDCSLEQMTEVAYQVRQSARIMIGSEESPPGPGYPYDKWLTDLKNGGATNCDVGNSIIQEFINDSSYLSNSQYSTEMTQSMVDLSQMGNVATALNNFGAVLNRYVVQQATLFSTLRNTATGAMGAAQHYTTNYADNKDLWDYANLVRTASVPTDMQVAAYNLQVSLIGPSGAILEEAHGPTGQDGSYGLAIYVPSPTSYITTYSNLALATAAPHWPQFLQNQLP